MANAFIHSKSSVKKFGGVIEDYLQIHIKMDCSKAYIPDNRHRILTHTSFWIHEVMIPIYGYMFKNSDGKDVSIKDVCEQHILEDFAMKFIPTPQDFIENMNFQDWMQNGLKGTPSSFKKLSDKEHIKVNLD
mgnify:CR=1 FL=1|jgi:hypothetical protein